MMCCLAIVVMDYEKDLISWSRSELILSRVSALEIYLKSLTN